METKAWSYNKNKNTNKNKIYLISGKTLYYFGKVFYDGTERIGAPKVQASNLSNLYHMLKMILISNECTFL